MASYRHRATFQSDIATEVYDEERQDKIITRLNVLFITFNRDTDERVYTRYFIDLPPPSDNFIPYDLVDHHIMRKWAAMYGDAIYYQDVNVSKLHDSVEAS